MEVDILKLFQLGNPAPKGKYWDFEILNTFTSSLSFKNTWQKVFKDHIKLRLLSLL